jgi:kinetochore protein Nuf2
MGRPTTAYSFPKLKLPDLLSNLSDMGLTNVKDKDITEPRPEFVQNVYECLIELCMSKTREELNQGNFTGMDAIKWQVCAVSCPLPSPFAGRAALTMSSVWCVCVLRVRARCVPASPQELHEESIPKANFFRTCQRLLQDCGVSDFSLADWMRPTSGRLIHNLSAIINFAKFREEKLEGLHALTTDLVCASCV